MLRQLVRNCQKHCALSDDYAKFILRSSESCRTNVNRVPDALTLEPEKTRNKKPVREKTREKGSNLIVAQLCDLLTNGTL